MNARTQRACAWCGPAFLALFAVGFLVAGFLPPPTPHDSAAEVARMFADDEQRIRAGLQIAWSSSLLFVPFVALVSQLMKRVEGEFAPMAATQLAAGLGSALVFVLPLWNLQAADFRPGRDPQIIQALADLGWLPFVGAWAVPAAQSVALAVVILQDDGAPRVFPRWAGFFNLWVALLYVPAIAMPFFTHGALAWNGLLPFWLGAAAFFGWIVVMTTLALRAINAGALRRLDVAS